MKHSTPVIQSVTSRGLTKFWQGFAELRDDEAFTWSESWQRKADGELSKRNVSAETKVFGKNVGKKNETTPWEQAVFNIGSDERKKRKKGYHEEGEVIETNPLPMLAHKFTDRSHNITYPALVSPKLDGFRAVTDGKKFWMRGGDDFPQEVIEHLLFDTKGHIVDGELMLPAPHNNVQDTSKVARKFRDKNDPEIPEGYCSRDLNFHVFDIMDESLTTLYRQDLAKTLAEDSNNEQVTYVSTFEIANEQGVYKYLELFESHGHEGVMIRNLDGKYTINQRSKDLQKLKNFQEAEFKIVGCVDGKGREEGALMYVCIAENGKEFNSRPLGTIEDRQRLWKEFQIGTFAPVGKNLTVRFQDRTKDGLPHFNSGVVIRWDM